MGNKACLHRFFEKRSLLAPLLRETKLAYTVTLGTTLGNEACLHRYVGKRSLFTSLLWETKLAYTVTLGNEACLHCCFGKRCFMLTPLLYVYFIVHIVTESLVEDWQCQMSHPLKIKSFTSLITLGNEACLHRNIWKTTFQLHAP